MKMEVRKSTSLLRRSFLSRLGPVQETRSEQENARGPLGLTTLYCPEQAVADVVFVHGLGGGSRSTWTKRGDASTFWPREWLPKDTQLQDVRIHSFGYESSPQKSSILHVYDFAKSLLNSLQTCPSIPEASEQPLIFVAHSMGGLVIKRAYIYAKQKPQYTSIANRTQVMIFLGTPHRGSDLAATLKRILDILPGSRPFVNDLKPGSLAIQAINDEFPLHCQNLRLYTFFETIPMTIGSYKGLVVEKDSAILGYREEIVTYMMADHREICKFANPADANYQTMRNNLASAINHCRIDAWALREGLDSRQSLHLNDFLGISEAPENELMDVEKVRTDGSCLWIFERTNFLRWRDSGEASIYWISAAPATGKSVLSGSVIRHFRKTSKDMCFYFFDYRDESKVKIDGLLLSMLWQMAQRHSHVRNFLLSIREKENVLDKSDYRSIWRKLFANGILQLTFSHPQYWIIDAIDQCDMSSDLVLLLAEIVSSCNIRIFLTSRDGYKLHSLPVPRRVDIYSEEVTLSDTRADIRLFLETNRYKLPGINDKAKGKMMLYILTTSGSCFLWTNLILDELCRASTAREVDQILEGIPSGLQNLYSRMLQKMSTGSRGNRLLKAILTWTTTSIRPLKTDELHHALQIQLDDQIDNIEKAISSSCGQLLSVDAQSQVQMIHQTARDFLLQPALESEFSISLTQAHEELAMTCLIYLNSKEMKDARNCNDSTPLVFTKRCAFVSYACTQVFEHLSRSQPNKKSLVLAVIDFLTSPSVLAWVEYIAANKSLTSLAQASETLELVHQNLPESISSQDAVLIKRWSVDLMKLMTVFGKNLLDYPSSIFDLIPPFFPVESAIRQLFVAPARGINVANVYEKGEDQQALTVVRPQELITSLELSTEYLALGLKSGRISVFNGVSYQLETDVFHEEWVKILSLDLKSSLLASSGRAFLRLWRTDTWQQVWMMNTNQQIMSVAFVEENQLFIGAMRNNQLIFCDLQSGIVQNSSNWAVDSEAMSSLAFRCPTVIAFCTTSLLMAVSYRGFDILLWDLRRNKLYDFYSQEKGSRSLHETQQYTTSANGLVFGRKLSANLLAVSYYDGELVVFDTLQGTASQRTLANAHTLSSSREGQILATGHSSGLVQLFDFQSLKLLQRVTLESGFRNFQVNCDSWCILDVQGSQCQIRDLSNLFVDGDAVENDDARPKSAVILPDLKFEKERGFITAICYSENDDRLICGKDDGSLCVCDVESGQKRQEALDEGSGISISAVCFDVGSKTLATVDVSSLVIVRRLFSGVDSWKDARILLNERAGMAVRQVLFNSKTTRILVNTAEKTTLWSISDHDSVIVQEAISLDQSRSRWFTHPQRRDQVILIQSNVAHIFDWLDLKRLTGPSGIVMDVDLPPDLSIDSVTTCFEDTAIVTMFRETRKSQFESKVLLWETSDFNCETAKITPCSKYRDLVDHIEVIVGEISGALVFLDGDDWVCSTSPKLGINGTYDKHFILPSDWVSANPDNLFCITRKRGIIFAKGKEVAIVKRGLEKVEIRHVSEARMTTPRSLCL